MTTVIKTAIVIDFFYLLEQSRRLGVLIEPSKVIDALNKMLALTPEGVIRFSAGTTIEVASAQLFSLNHQSEINLNEEITYQTKLGRLALKIQRHGFQLQILKIAGSKEEALKSYRENIDMEVESLLKRGYQVIVIGSDWLLSKIANNTDTVNLNFLTDEYQGQYPNVTVYKFDTRVGIFTDFKRGFNTGLSLAYEAREVHAQGRYVDHLQEACCT